MTPGVRLIVAVECRKASLLSLWVGGEGEQTLICQH